MPRTLQGNISRRPSRPSLFFLSLLSLNVLLFVELSLVFTATQAQAQAVCAK